MSVGNESRQQNPSPDALATVSLAAIANNLRFYRLFNAITVLRIGVMITTTCTVTAPVVSFDKRLINGSDVGRVNGALGIGLLTFPAVALCVAGTVIYKEVESDATAGNEIVVQVTTAATAGAGIPFVEYINRHESAANMSNMIAGT